MICIYLLASAFYIYQYFKHVPYYNPLVSIVWGTLLLFHGYVALNAFLMMLIEIYGHILIMLISIPIIGWFVASLRKKRVEQLMLMSIEKMGGDVEAGSHIQAVQALIADARAAQTEDGFLIGYVNLHAVECHNAECPCKNDSDLYDVRSDRFSHRTASFHKDYVFLYHLNKQLYEDALNKFANSTRLHIDYSYFLYNSMRNIHAALMELDAAIKKKPSIYQQFTIFRIKDLIENFAKEEAVKGKEAYHELTNVIEFERLLAECQKTVEQVCNQQIEFWTQLNSQLPDMNVLHDLAGKIFDGTREGERLWIELCKINSNYPRALRMYGEYLSLVKNNEQQGCELIDKERANLNKKSVDELVKSSNSLFAADTAVIHISGNKESAGKIVKANDAISKVFGYNKSEVINHLVNILMPNLFAKRHNEFLQKFFKTGRKPLFNHETFLYALNRDGCCFQVKVVIKQLPCLSEGLQYVGMVRQTRADYSYIITDTSGVIDCISLGVKEALRLNASIFKDNKINIQILAPDLIKVFSLGERKRTLLEKFREQGGQKITLYVPKDFAEQARVGKKKKVKNPRSPKNLRVELKRKPKTKDVRYRQLNKDINKHGGVASEPMTVHELLRTLEYKEYEVKQNVRCEIQDLTFGSAYKNFEPLKLRIFKLTGISSKYARGNADLSSGDTLIQSHSGASFDWRDQKSEEFSSRYDPVNHQEESKGILQYFMHSENLMAKAKKNEEKPEPESNQVTERMPGIVATTENRVETIEEHPLDTLKSPSPKKPSDYEEVKESVKREQDTSEGKKEAFSNNENEQNPFMSHKGSIGDSDHNSQSEVKKDEGGDESLLTKNKIRDMKKERHVKIQNMFTTKQRSVNFDGFGDGQRRDRSLDFKSAASVKLKDIEGDTNEKGSKLSDKRSTELGKKSSKDQRSLNMEKKLLKQAKKRMQSKIIPNPKYAEGDDRLPEIPEYRLGEEELKLRRTLQAHGIKLKEKRKPRKKKQKSENGSESAADDNEEEKSEESEKEESDSEEENQETQSSVTSGSTGSTIRSFYSLRAAIDEKFVPASIRMLKCTANILFLLVMCVAIVYFVIQLVLFSKINSNLKNIRYSENRYNYLFKLDQNIVKLLFMNVNAEKGDKISTIFQDYGSAAAAFESITSDLRQAATSLKDVQTELSSRIADFSEDLSNQINPQDVGLIYMEAEGMPVGYNYTIWQAIMEVVVSAFEISNMEVEEIDDSKSPNVYFVTRNLLNDLLVNLDESTNAISSNIKSSKDTNVVIFLILLCSGSAAIAISAGVLMPIIRKVKMNKQDVLELFMNVKKVDVDEELGKCRKFNSRFQANQETEMDQLEQEEGKEEEQDEKARKSAEHDKGGRRRRKRFKQLVVGLGMIAFQFSFVMLIMEGYFLLTYFLSTTFLNQVISLTAELSKLASRLPNHSLFLVIIE